LRVRTQKVPNLVAQLDQYLASVNYQSNPQYLYIVDGIAFGNDVSDALALWRRIRTHRRRSLSAR